MDHLPIEQSLSRTLVRRFRAVLKHQKGAVLHNLVFRIGGDRQVFAVHFTPIARGAAMEGVLIMFGGSLERAANAAQPAAASASPVNSRRPAARKKKAGTQNSHARKR